MTRSIIMVLLVSTVAMPVLALADQESDVPIEASRFENGQPVPVNVYDRLELKNGDVIQGVNNVPVADPGQAFEMMSELKSANHFEDSVESGQAQVQAPDPSYSPPLREDTTSERQ